MMQTITLNGSSTLTASQQPAMGAAGGDLFAMLLGQLGLLADPPGMAVPPTATPTQAGDEPRANEPAAQGFSFIDLTLRLPAPTMSLPADDSPAMDGQEDLSGTALASEWMDSLPADASQFADDLPLTNAVLPAVADELGAPMPELDLPTTNDTHPPAAATTTPVAHATSLEPMIDEPASEPLDTIQSGMSYLTALMTRLSDATMPAAEATPATSDTELAASFMPSVAERRLWQARDAQLTLTAGRVDIGEDGQLDARLRQFSTHGMPWTPFGRPAAPVELSAPQSSAMQAEPLPSSQAGILPPNMAGGGAAGSAMAPWPSLQDDLEPRPVDVDMPDGFAAALKSTEAAMSAERVYAPNAALAAQAPAITMQLAQAIDGSSQRFEVQLAPEELGRVEISMEFDGDNRTQLTILVERGETLDLLLRDQRQLERMLQAQGLQLDGGIQLGLRQERQDGQPRQGFMGEPWQGDSDARPEAPDAGVIETVRPLLRGNGLYDVVI